MLGLLYKDFIIMKKELLLNGLGIVIASIILFLPWQSWLEDTGAATEQLNGALFIFGIFPVFVYFFMFQLISGLQDYLFLVDENSYYCAFVVSTPMGVRGQVLSKYYGVLLLSFAGVIWGMICDMLSSLFYGESNSAMMIYVSFFFIQLFLRAVEIPFMIRYGQKKGKIVKVLMVIVAFFAVMVYLLFGDLHNVTLDSIIEAGVRWLSGTQLSHMLSWGVALFPYAAVFAYYSSYRISLKLWQKGVANYER